MMAMGRKVVAAATILVVLSSILPLALGLFKTNIIDTSWTSNVIQYLNSSQPYPEWKEEYNLNAYTITLFENGTSTFVNATNGDGFSSFLLDLVARANGEMSSVSDAYLSNVTQNDKVVYLRCRFGYNFTQTRTIGWDAFFVLEDKLNDGSLQGTIFVEDDSNDVRTWQHWAILLGPTPSPTLSPSPSLGELPYAAGNFFPASNSANIPLNTTISISFSRPPSICSLNLTPNVAVKERVFEAQGSSGTYIFYLAEELKPQTTYVVTITYGQETAPEGFKPTTTRTWHFTTEANPIQQPTERPTPMPIGIQAENYAPMIITFALVILAAAVGLLVYFKKIREQK